MRWLGADISEAYDPAYPEYLQLAHRRPTFQQNAPALCWHVALWRDDRLRGSSDREKYESDRKDWIDKTLNPLLRVLQTGFPARPGDDPEANFQQFSHRPSESEKGRGVVWPYSLHFMMRWHDVVVRCVVSYSSDFCTFTFIADLQTSIENRLTVVADKKLDKLAEALQQALSRIGPDYKKHTQSHDFTRGVPWRDAPPTTDETNASALIFANFWRDFANAIRQKSNIAPAMPIFPGQIFADFRALVARIDPDWPRILQSNSGATELLEAERSDLRVHHRRFDDLEARWVLSAIWPFFKASSPGQNTDLKRRDSVACLMLDRQVIYLSSLGAQEDIDIASRLLRTAGQGVDVNVIEKNPPVCFFLLLKGRPNRRQLGRLIERINNLGTLRLAALRDFGTFREISVDVRHFGAELDAITTDLMEVSNRIAQKNVSDADGIADEQAEIEKRLITLAKKINDSSNKIAGGLHYRAARTRIIVNSFKQRVEDLRITRIEFWQPYDEFVRRTLYEMYDSMSSVDERMFALRNRVRQVLTGVQTTALVQLTKGIRKLNSEANELTDGILRVQRGTEVLQVILFIIAISAFGGELFEAVFKSSPPIVHHVPLLLDAWREAINLEAAADKISIETIGSIGKVIGYMLGFGTAILVYPSFSFFFRWLSRRGRSKDVS